MVRCDKCPALGPYVTSTLTTYSGILRNTTIKKFRHKIFDFGLRNYAIRSLGGSRNPAPPPAPHPPPHPMLAAASKLSCERASPVAARGASATPTAVPRGALGPRALLSVHQPSAGPAQTRRAPAEAPVSSHEAMRACGRLGWRPPRSLRTFRGANRGRKKIENSRFASPAMEM